MEGMTNLNAMTDHNSNPKLILYAEDEYYNYLLLVKMLRNYNVELIQAKDGLSAIEQVAENPAINLVFMDIKMDGIDGVEATRQIKKIRPELPVIALTAFALLGDKERIMEAGCDDYLVKPINRNQLDEIIHSYLNL